MAGPPAKPGGLFYGIYAATKLPEHFAPLLILLVGGSTGRTSGSAVFTGMLVDIGGELASGPDFRRSHALVGNEVRAGRGANLIQ